MPFLEIEAKILEIDREEVEKNLLSLGAEKIFDGELVSFSYTSPNGKRVRMRTFNNVQTLLTYKEKAWESAFATQENEYEIEIQNPDTMDYILKTTGFECVAKIIKQRTSYKLNNTRYEIDDYGTIPVFIEFESPSEEALIKAAEALGFKKEDLFLWGVKLLEEHYGVRLNIL